MELPKFAFFLKKSKAGAFLAESWIQALEETRDEIDQVYDHRLSDVENEKAYSLLDRLAPKRNATERSIAVALKDIELFDLFQFEISSAYKEDFRDGMCHREGSDTDYIKDILDEFYSEHPNMLVVNLIPVDFSGTIGFVVMPKDMNP